MKIVDETKLDYSDVLIRPKSSHTASRAKVDLIRRFDKFPHSPRFLEACPIMVSNMDTTGTLKMADALMSNDWITCLHKHYDIEKLTDYFTCGGACDIHVTSSLGQLIWYSTGVTDDDISRLRGFVSGTHGFSPNLCIDVANGYTDLFVDRVAAIREICPNSIIMAGNVATPEMVERLIRQGMADIVKVGIGPGSVCTTRLVTGVGYPQLSAVLECADAAHGSSGGYICADGGCTTSGDVCKAFGANADFVMLGGMLAGTDECDGEWEFEDPRIEIGANNSTRIIGGTKKKGLKYYGMASNTAKSKYNGDKSYRASEGKAVMVPYKGKVEDIVHQIEGGIRSCCAYIGADHIRHMGKCTTFVKVSRTHNQVYENPNQFSAEEFRDPKPSN